MSAEHDVTGTVRRWLREPVELEDGGLQHVLASLPSTPQLRGWSGWWRPSPGSGPVAGDRIRGVPRSYRLLALLALTSLAAGVVLLSAGSSRSTPTSSALTGATAIAAGDHHTCVLFDAGRVACWGDNSSGQLGDGTTVNRPQAIEVANLDGATAIAAADLRSCTLMADHRVLCWGDESTTPLEIDGLDGASAISGGVGRTCAIVREGRVACWPRAATGAIPVPGIEGATAIVVGYFDSCAIVDGGRVLCWPSDGGMPAEVPGLEGAIALAAGQEVMGPPHTCAIVAGGRVRCWGGNEYLQLGDGTRTDKIVETPVDVIDLAGATGLAAGGAHTCAIVAEGRVRCWGWNLNGELGDPTITAGVVSTPVEVVGVEGATALAAGWTHTCAIVAEGRVHCWGAGMPGDSATHEGHDLVEVMAPRRPPEPSPTIGGTSGVNQTASPSSR